MLRSFVAGLLLAAGFAATLVAAPKEVYTDPKDSDLPVDFKIQGEYVGKLDGKGEIGAQIIALGKNSFQAVLLPGGLPGAGWDGKNKILMDGKLDGSKAAFSAPMGKHNYLAQKPEEFSATSKFPPEGHMTGSGECDGEKFSGKLDAGLSFDLKKVVRQSPTMGAKAPEGAIVLFDGSNKDAWTAGRVDAATKFLNTDGGDIKTKEKFNSYTMHLEFMLPYRPDARGQGRGNSGFYQIDLYEMQILDSFGLDGKDNECGGIYTKKSPDVNMCLPPLVWQTYDVEFTNAVTENGKKTKPPVFSAKHNGVPIHTNYEIPGVTGGSRQEPEGTPGRISLQGHGNPLQFRNIWIVEKK